MECTVGSSSSCSLEDGAEKAGEKAVDDDDDDDDEDEEDEEDEQYDQDAIGRVIGERPSR